MVCAKKSNEYSFDFFAQNNVFDEVELKSLLTSCGSFQCPNQVITEWSKTIGISFDTFPACLTIPNSFNSQNSFNEWVKLFNSFSARLNLFNDFIGLFNEFEICLTVFNNF